METFTLELPTLFGDHHVLEVRRVLLALPGVREVYASSAFQTVEVQYDGTQIDADRLHQALAEAGYLGELELTTENPVPAAPAERMEGQKVFFRHSGAFEQTKGVITFGQKVPGGGRAIWPCPGLGVLTNREEEATHG